MCGGRRSFPTGYRGGQWPDHSARGHWSPRGGLWPFLTGYRGGQWPDSGPGGCWSPRRGLWPLHTGYCSGQWPDRSPGGCWSLRGGRWPFPTGYREGQWPCHSLRGRWSPWGEPCADTAPRGQAGRSATSPLQRKRSGIGHQRPVCPPPAGHQEIIVLVQESDPVPSKTVKPPTSKNNKVRKPILEYSERCFLTLPKPRWYPSPVSPCACWRYRSCPCSRQPFTKWWKMAPSPLRGRQVTGQYRWPTCRLLRGCLYFRKQGHGADRPMDSPRKGEGSDHFVAQDLKKSNDQLLSYLQKKDKKWRHHSSNDQPRQKKHKAEQ